MVLRAIDAVDNSLAFSFITVGILAVIIGELNRVHTEEASAFN